MRNLFITLLNCFLLFACSNEDAGNKVLNTPPYSLVTDSIRQQPENAALYFRRGGMLYAGNQLDLAENDLRKAWELKHVEEHAVRLAAVLKQRNADKAIAFLEEAAQKLPGNLFVQVSLAQGYKSKGQADKALQLCNEVIKDFPNNIDALLLKAEILREQNKDAEALATLETAYQYAPGDVELVHSLAFDYAEAKNSRVLALADSLIAVDVEKSHAEPYYFKGVYFSNTGNLPEAIRQFDEAIRTDHNFLNAYINKGIIYFDQKKYGQAMQSFELALNVFPDEADPYYWIAKTQEATGNKTEAKVNYQRAYSLDKNMTEAKEAADKL